jgi:hypothetical protein
MRIRWACAVLVSMGSASCASAPAGDAALDALDATPFDALDATQFDALDATQFDALDATPFDARENEGALAASASRGCVREDILSWAVGTSVWAASADGLCPTRVSVVARGSPFRHAICGEIAPCCDFFARCEFDVTFDVSHAGRDFECAAPSRSELRGCRCLGNRIECDYARTYCPATLPAGWTCNATPGSRVFEYSLCSDCTIVRDSGLRDDGAVDAR